MLREEPDFLYYASRSSDARGAAGKYICDLRGTKMSRCIVVDSLHLERTVTHDLE